MKTFRWIEKILELIFPRNIKCIYCKKEIEKSSKYSICNECYNRMDFVSSYDKRCIKCNRPLSNDSPYEHCRDCLEEYRSFDLVIAGVVYHDIMKSLLHDFKYHDKRYLGYYFSSIILDMELPRYVYDFDIIVAVPSSKKKVRSRGYNQAEILAQNIEDALEIDMIKDLLIKIDTGMDQNRLGKMERKSNIRGSIIYNEKYSYLDNKKIILVDDVFTTGSTVNECSKVLKENGAKMVLVMVSAIASLE